MSWMLCLPTASLFLLLLPCFPAQNGGENEQSADVVSVWKGDSVNIICSINGSGDHEGMHLQTNRGNINVVYFSMHNSPNVFPALANRTDCSREGRNYRTTLHNLNESDSNIYLCSERVKIKGHHDILKGKRTIVIVKARGGGALKQSPLYVSPQQGQSVSITCVMSSFREDEGIYLLRTHVRPEEVLYVSNQNAATILPAFANRLNYSKEGKQIVITLHNLQKNDSDNYVCAEEMKNSPLLSASGTMVLVKEGEQACPGQECTDNPWVMYSLIIVVALLFSALVCCTLYHVNIKKYFQKKTPNVVYEDMSYGSRRNTLVRINPYSKGN